MSRPIEPARPPGAAQRPSRRTPRWLVAFTLLPLAAAAGDPPAPATSVQSVVVTARKLAVETLIDRKVYTVEADLQSAFGSVSDVLTAIPSVDIDTDGVVSLRGDSNVLILVDGKPSALYSGASAGENLQSIPAKDIERIEVITNPSAQFRAEGTAGIINIVTRRRQEDGTAGSVQGSLGSGGRSVIGGSVAHKSGALSLALTATYRHDYKQRSLRTDLVSVDPQTGARVDHASAIEERVRRNNPPVQLSGRYDFNERQSMTVSLSRTGRAGLRTYDEDNTTTAADGTALGAAGRRSAGHDREVIVESEVGFSQRLARPGETLELSASRTAATESEHYDYTNVAVLPAAPTFYDNLGFRDERADSEIDLDYALPWMKTRTLKLGGSFEQRDFLYRARGYTVDAPSGAQVEDLSLHNDFVYWRQIGALYGTLQATVGDWSWLGGLRAEYTRAEGRQLTQQVTNATHEFQLFPSLHVERSLAEHSTVSLGASRRVTRPEPDSLDPYVDREYTPMLRSGNPDLRPQYTQSYEAGYAYDAGGGTATLTAYYRRNRDSTTDFTADLGNGFTLQTRVNLPHNDAAGLEFTANGMLRPKLAYSLSGNAFYSQIDATALGTPGLRSTAGVNGKLKLDWRATPADSAQLTVNRTDRRLTPQGSVAAYTVANLGYRHVLRPSLTVVATLSDVFNGQRFERFATTPSFTSHTLRTVRGRVVWVGLVRSFGAAAKPKPESFDYDP